MEAYLDNSATTRCSERAKNKMVQILTEDYGNPSSLHNMGKTAEDYIKEAKEQIAKTLRCDEKEIIFTSGGTESNNMALIGGALANKRQGKHIITTAIEHASVQAPLAYLKELGYEITELSVDHDGIISLEELRDAVREDTVLVSIMMVNNEIGAVEPVEEAAKVIKAKNPDTLFHVDAIQAYGKYRICPKKLGIDLLSVSGHKIHAPKGTGFLYVRKKKRIPPFIHGGGQESGVRAGTENVPGIVGMGKAAAMAMESLKERMEIETRMRDYLIYSVLKQVPKVRLNGEWNNRLPNNVDFCFDELEGGNLLVMLDMDGICASAGSACSSGEHEPSHVLTAIGVPPEIARGALRLTLNEKITAEQIDYVTACIKKNVTILRGQKETVKFT